MEQPPRTKYGLFVHRNMEPTLIEVGIDEAGKGPMFGRVYAAAVVLPKNREDFEYDDLRDSKKITSSKKLNKIAEYIKENAQAWAVCFEDEKTISECYDEDGNLKEGPEDITACCNKVLDRKIENDPNALNRGNSGNLTINHSLGSWRHEILHGFHLNDEYSNASYPFSAQGEDDSILKRSSSDHSRLKTRHIEEILDNLSCSATP